MSPGTSASASAWTWFISGTGALVHADVDVAPGDMARFHRESEVAAIRRLRWMTAILLGFNLVFWTTDAWTFVDLPDVKRTLGEGRLHITLWGALVFAASYVPRRLRVPGGWIAMGMTCVIVGWTLGRIGGPGTAWFHYSYPFLFFGLIVWVRPVHRLLLSAFVAGIMGVAYFAPHPQHLLEPMARSAVGNLVYIAAISTLIGLYIDHMRLRVFLLGCARERDLDGLEHRVASQTHQIQALLDHVETAREAERRELAAELHDDMGQVLTGLRCVVKVARARPDPDAETREADWAQAAMILRHGTRSLRMVLERLRPSVLDDLGLGAAAEWLVQRTTSVSGLACALDLDLPDEQSLDALSEAHAALAFRIMQESLTNVVKHAAASRVDVRLRIDAGVLVLTIDDDGGGFEGEPYRKGGLGVLGMTERARAVGGVLAVRAMASGGTQVELRLPLEGDL